jgi:ribosomal-protein-serine acetyltransferase
VERRQSTGADYGVMVTRSGRLPELIHGQGVELRRWRPIDAEALAQVVAESAEHLRPWMPWISQEPLALETRRALIEGWEAEWEAGGDLYQGIFSEDRIVGGCGLHSRVGPEGLEIGYWIHPAYTRRGLATAAARALAQAALSLAEISHVEIHHDRANRASGAIPRRLGFTFVGEVPDEISAPGEEGVEWIWRMEAAQWRNLHPQGAGRTG